MRPLVNGRKKGNAVVTEEEKLLVLEGSSDIDLVINEDDVVEPSTSHTEVNNNTTVSEKNCSL